MSQYLIWNKRGGAWWRPNGRGYTDNPDLAGHYSHTEAKSICDDTHGDHIPYQASSPLVARKRNEYLQRKRIELRGAMGTMTVQQAAAAFGELLAERADMAERGGI